MAAVAGGQSSLSTLSPNTYNCAAYISTTTTLFILPPAAQLRGGCRASLSVSASMRDAEALIRSGEVVSVSPKQSQPLVSTGGYKILDVRPVWEKEKAFVSGSYHIPLFVEDEDMSLITLLKKWIHFGYIGLWMGHRLTVENDQFVQQVQKVVPRKEEKLLVACGEGLRSMIAIDLLHNDGYTQLAWMSGGFNNARLGDFDNVQGETKLQFATIGGVSEYFLKIILLAQGLVSQLEGLVSPK